MKHVAYLLASLAFLAMNGVGSGADPAPTQKGPPKGYPDLVAGLKATPGCLGVETARTDSGKQLIFAWFANKRAAKKWYYSEMHQDLMNRFFPNYVPQKPLQDVSEDSGPILTIASITPAAKPQFKESVMPISQIAIELYQPVPGGVFLGGRFAPAAVQVPHMKDASPKK